MTTIDAEEKLLAQTLKKLCNKNGKEKNPKKSAEILHKLGSVYRKRSPDFICLIKSAALMNAAIARSPDNVELIENDLNELCKHLLDISCAANKSSDLVLHAQIVKQAITKLRSFVDDELGKIKDIPENVTGEKLKQLERLKIESIQVLQDEITKDYLKIMSNLSSYCQEVMGDPPCQFAIAGMGSLARKEITPYSDFEHIILLESVADNERETVLNYFRWFTVIFQIILINLQETIIPSVAISSLNDETSEHCNWFYDNFTIRGVCFDGMMLHACKFPLGRQQTTKKKPWKTELIKPVDEMLQYLNSDEDLKNGYHLSDILTKTCFVYGKRSLFEKFETGAFSILDDQDNDQNLKTIKDQLINDLQKHSTRSTLLRVSSENKLDVKKHVYRITSLFTSALGKIHRIRASSGFHIVVQLAEKQVISDYAKHKLMYAIALSCEIRLRWYMKSKSQTDFIVNEDSVSTFLNIVGRASSLSYFQISYALQCDISKRFDLHKDNFYSCPRLLNISLFGWFNDKTNFLLYLTSQNDLKFNRQRFIDFDDCLKSLETDMINDYNKKIFCINTSQDENDFVEKYIVSYFYNFGNMMFILNCFDDALECYDKSLMALKTFLPRDILSILNETKNKDFSDLLFQNLVDCIDEERVPSRIDQNSSKQNNLWHNSTFELLLDILHRKCICFKNLKKFVKIEYHLKKLLHIFHQIQADTLSVQFASITYLLGAHFFQSKSFPKAIKYFETSLKVLEKLPITFEINCRLIQTLHDLAVSALEINNRLKAECCLEKIIQITEHMPFNDESKIPFIDIKLNIGDILQQMCKYSEAQKCFSEVLEMCSEISYIIHDGETIPLVLGKLGECLMEEKKFTEAKTNFEECLRLLKQTTLNIDEDRNICGVLSNLGSCLTEIHQLDEAKSYMEKSLQIAENISVNINKDANIARILFNLGRCLVISEKFVVSEKYLKKSLKIKEQLSPDNNESKDFAENFRVLGQCSIGMNRLKKAKSYLEVSLKIYQKIAYKNDSDELNEHLAYIMHDLAWCLMTMKKYNEGIKYFKKSIETRKKSSRDVDSDSTFANTLRGLGCCLMNINNFDHAFVYLKQSLQILQCVSRDYTSQLPLCMILWDVGNCLVSLHRFEEASNHLKESVHIVRKLSSENFHEAKQHKPEIEESYRDCLKKVKQQL